ncbi:MAG: hypothetical protein FWC50_03425 [Planctomycetaceae bacterium]|nr:hypothetical protein [Planctomycetaceae bacterium]
MKAKYKRIIVLTILFSLLLIFAVIIHGYKGKNNYYFFADNFTDTILTYDNVIGPCHYDFQFNKFDVGCGYDFMNKHFPEIANSNSESGNVCFITEVKIYSGRGFMKKHLATFVEENKIDKEEGRKKMRKENSRDFIDSLGNPLYYNFMPPRMKLHFDIEHVKYSDVSPIDVSPILGIQRVDLPDSNKITIYITGEMQIYYDMTYSLGYENGSGIKRTVFIMGSRNNPLLSIRNNINSKNR